MAETLISPGVFLNENDLSQIQEGPITVGAALVGPTVKGPVNVPTLVRSYSDFTSKFGSLFVSGGTNYEYLTSMAAVNYFDQGGESLLVTRVVSGTYSPATASVAANQNGTLGAFASASFTLTSADTGSYRLFRIGVPGINDFYFAVYPYANPGTNFSYGDEDYVYVGVGENTTIDTVGNAITGAINYNNGQYTDSRFTASYDISTNKLTISSRVAGNDYNNLWYVSHSLQWQADTSGQVDYFQGGTESVSSTSFVLETLSTGKIMNNDPGAASANEGSLVSGSIDNVRWEVTAADTGSGTFTLIIRRGDDYTNQKSVLETWSGLSLDPNQNNYIEYVIGNQSFTPIQDEVGQYYLQTTGSYVVNSRYVRVKSVQLPTPNYLDSLGNPQQAYKSYIPSLGSGSLNGAFGGAAGEVLTAAAVNLFENIPTSTSTSATPSTNVQGVFASDYNTAISLLSNKDQYDYKTIFVPGLTNQNASSTIATLLSNTQDRGDAIAVIDMVTYNQAISLVTSQAQSIDSSYGATYWPWVQLRSKETGKLFYCPASTIVPAAYEYNDKVAAEWFAPAGLNRGGLSTVIQPERRLTVSQRDSLYSGKVNPIAIFPGQGTVIYGQKTLQAKPSALDRVNVRRLLISLKRYIGGIAEGLVFEQNSQVTRNNFLNRVNPYLQLVQQKQGLYSFRVVMDDSNNTPDVIDRNQLVGAIYLQPTKTAEYIILDFNILPTGATFGQ
jgi:phage tail sheath protein FI